MSDGSYLEIYSVTNRKPVQFRQNRRDMIKARLLGHARHFPSLQGINVMPAGPLQSDFSNRGGSLLAGKLARDRER